MRDVWTIVAKDLRLRARDRSVFLFGIVAPLALAAALAAVFGPLDDAPAVDVAVAIDASALAGAVTSSLWPMDADGVLGSITTFESRDALLVAVEDGAVDAGLVVTDGSIEVVSSPDAPVGGLVLAAVAERVARDTALVTAAATATGRPVPEVAAAVAAVPPAGVDTRTVGVAQVDATTYVAAGMAVFFLFFAVGLAVTGMLEEERDGTLARLRTLPIRPAAPLAAKAVSAVLVGSVSMGVLVATTTWLLGASWGPTLRLAPLVVAAVLAATGVVGLVAAGARTPESASSTQAVVGTVLGTVGGSFFPIADDGLLGTVAAITPHHWFLEGLTAVAGGAALARVVRPTAVLLLIAVVTAGIAAAVLRRRLEV